jgi:hypothetical protein
VWSQAVQAQVRVELPGRIRAVPITASNSIITLADPATALLSGYSAAVSCAVQLVPKSPFRQEMNDAMD